MMFMSTFASETSISLTSLKTFFTASFDRGDSPELRRGFLPDLLLGVPVGLSRGFPTCTCNDVRVMRFENRVGLWRSLETVCYYI